MNYGSRVTTNPSKRNQQSAKMGGKQEKSNVLIVISLTIAAVPQSYAPSMINTMALTKIMRNGLKRGQCLTTKSFAMTDLNIKT